MVKFYILQIRMGKINIDDVPARWRTMVANKIESESTEM